MNLFPNHIDTTLFLAAMFADKGSQTHEQFVSGIESLPPGFPRCVCGQCNDGDARSILEESVAMSIIKALFYVEPPADDYEEDYVKNLRWRVNWFKETYGKKEKA